MIGKASEIKMTGVFEGTMGVEKFLHDNPDLIVLQMLIAPTENKDYFYIVYKEATQ
jgi:hypothetical protein